MKAAVVHSFAEPLTIDEIPVPAPGPEQVLIRVEASGLCHTDIHAAHGDWPAKPSPPFVPGHEAVGLIEQIGLGNAHGLELGMRVAVPWLGYACGDCRYCNSGRETLCESQQNTGYSVDGGFAEYMIGWARHVVRVPDGVDPADAAPLTCAGVTTYKAVKESGCTSSSRVVVFGVGGLGHMALQYAKITGAEVIAVDINPERLATAVGLGADLVINPLEEDPIQVIQALGGADAAIATAVSPKAFEQALGSLARGGTLVCVGMPAENVMGVPIFQTVVGGLTVKGSIVGTHQDVVDVFELHRRGLTKVERADARLEDVNEAIAAVLDGTAGAARTVFRLQPSPVRDRVGALAGAEVER